MIMVAEAAYFSTLLQDAARSRKIFNPFFVMCLLSMVILAINIPHMAALLCGIVRPEPFRAVVWMLKNMPIGMTWGMIFWQKVRAAEVMMSRD
jgi:hypothetical protein